MRKSITILAAVLAFFAVSCKKEALPDALTMGKSTYSADANGLVKDLVFETNADWTIKSDVDWITFDVAKGNAGKATVEMTVKPNTGYDPRDGKVTITAGDRVTVLAVEQSGISALSTAIVYKIDAVAQDINVDIKTNLDYKVDVEENSTWISVIKTKALVEGTIVLHVEANSGIGPRTGGFTITSGSLAQKYEVIQDAEYVKAKSAAGFYLANTADIYDDENYNYTTFKQFAVVLTMDNEDQVTLTVNAAGDADGKAFPTGDFNVDATGKFAAGTFTIKSDDINQKFYTTILKASKDEILIEDGEITITEDKGVYTITAVLVDAADVEHRYSYQGEIKTEDHSAGLNNYISYNIFRGNYATYFTTKANEWQISFHFNTPGAAFESGFMSFYYYTSAGEVANLAYPSAKCTFDNPQEDETIAYANGKTMAQPNTFHFSANVADGRRLVPAEGANPTFEIKRTENGSYDISFAGKFELWDYDTNGDYVKVADAADYSFSVNGVALAEAKGSDKKLRLDVDAEIVDTDYDTGTKYVSLWFGDPFSLGGNAFVLGLTSGNYPFYLSFYTTQPWTFEVNFGKAYCNTMFPLGKYEYAAEAKDFALLPTKFASSPYCYIKNDYTGTVFIPVGGSVTVGALGTLEFDVTAISSDGKITVKYTGKINSSLYYHRNKSKSANSLVISPFTPAP